MDQIFLIDNLAANAPTSKMIKREEYAKLRPDDMPKQVAFIFKPKKPLAIDKDMAEFLIKKYPDDIVVDTITKMIVPEEIEPEQDIPEEIEDDEPIETEEVSEENPVEVVEPAPEPNYQLASRFSKMKLTRLRIVAPKYGINPDGKRKGELIDLLEKADKAIIKG